jgi:hypothetical protein
MFLEENAPARSQAALRSTVTATRLYSTLILSISIFYLGSACNCGYTFILFKGRAGCSINCKCEDCKNPFGRKGKAHMVSQRSYFVLDVWINSTVQYIILHKYLNCRLDSYFSSSWDYHCLTIF